MRTAERFIQEFEHDILESTGLKNGMQVTVGDLSLVDDDNSREIIVQFELTLPDGTTTIARLMPTFYYTNHGGDVNERAEWLEYIGVGTFKENQQRLQQVEDGE